MTNIYRVLLEDQIDGKAFRFAIFVKGKHEFTFEQMAQYGYAEEDANRWNASNKALTEFPKAILIESRLIKPQILLTKYLCNGE